MKEIKKLTDDTITYKLEMNYKEVVEIACEKETILEALTYICIWESDRAIRQALVNDKSCERNPDGSAWETYFGHCLESVIERFTRTRSIGNLSELVVKDNNETKMYCKKCKSVEAEQWFGVTYEYIKNTYHLDVGYYRNPDLNGKSKCKLCNDLMHNHGWIDTPDGGHTVCPGDWIIKGNKGKFYPCKPDIFKATYKIKEDK